jgi:hypothetical protein
MVTIFTREPRIQVSIPHLTPTMQTLQQAMDYEAQGSDIFYQLKSFKFKNRFFNIHAGDYIEIRIKLKSVLSL